MADPFSVAGSAVGVVSLGISVCQGLVNYYSAFKGQGDEVDEMVGKVERLTDLLETLEHRLLSPRYRHSVSVEKVEQNIVECATSLKKLDEIVSKCTQESTVQDPRHTLRAISRRMLYPFKQKTLQDLSDAVSECQRDLATAMQILQIDQLSTVESSNAAILENTAITRRIIEVKSHEVRDMREDIQRLMEVAVPALMLSSMRSQSQGNTGTTAATALDMSSASLKPQSCGGRTTMGPESSFSLCRCRPRTKFVERRLQLGPVTLIRTSKSRAEHNETCQYFVPGDQEEGVGVRFQVGARSRRWNIMAALNYNHAVGTFSVAPTLMFKATVPGNHPLFQITEDIVYGRQDFEAGLQSIRLLFQNGEAAPNDVRDDGRNVLHNKVVLGYILDMKGEKNHAINGVLQQRIEQLVIAFLSLGTNVNERCKSGFHLLYLCHKHLFLYTYFNDERPYLYSLQKKIAMHRDCDYDSTEIFNFIECVLSFFWEQSLSVVYIWKTDVYLAKEMGLSNLCLAVLGKSIDEVDSILSQTPTSVSSTTPFEHTVLHLASDWPIGMATLLSRGGKPLVHALDLARKSPLDLACSYGCIPAVKLLLQADSPIDLDLIFYLEEQSDWELFEILIKELARRRNLLTQLARTELPEVKYQGLEIPVEHPMGDIETFLVLAELQKNYIPTTKALEYYGYAQMSEIHSVSSFGCWFGTTAKGADIVHNAGFLLDRNTKAYEEYQLGGQSVLFLRQHWPEQSTLTQRLDKMLWLLGRGITFSEYDVHDLFSPLHDSHSLDGENGDMFSSCEERTDLMLQLLSARSGILHECPCCIDVCFPAIASLRTDGKAPCHDIDDPDADNLIFAGLLGLLKACKIDFDSQYWIWAMPRLIHSVLYEACGLTHSFECCKGDWQVSDQDDVKEKQEEEEYMRSRLSTLTEELAAEYGESSMSLSDFLRDRVVIRALELVDGEEEVSPEDRKRLREVGVVLEEESESDGDEITNDELARQ